MDNTIRKKPNTNRMSGGETQVFAAKRLLPIINSGGSLTTHWLMANQPKQLPAD